VGFQPGQASVAGTYQVRDKDAHAWPEVFFEGVGWVAFEPTPGGGGGGADGPSGNPDAAGYTGVPYRPTTAAPAGGTEPGGSATPTTATVTPAPTTIPKNENDPAASTKTGNDEHGLLGVLLRVVAFVLIVVTLGSMALGIAWSVAERRRKRKREAATTPALRIAHAWHIAEEALALVRVTRRSTTTVDEWLDQLRRPAGGAASAGVERGTAAHAALVRLGGAVVDAAYGGAAIPESTAAQAEDDAKTVVLAAHAAAGWWRVFDWMIDPHPAIDDWRRDRSARRPALASTA
jgi:hypothetical protein